MKKILNGPTVWRAKCPVCDCEFEYDVSETIKVYDKTTLDVFRIIPCPGCKTNIKHSDSVSTTTETRREDTMTT
jgi:hypothetical protein